MKSYRDLEIYKESKRLAIEIHKISLLLPKFELFEEGGQIRRSSKSITSMIVEGYGRRRYKQILLNISYMPNRNVMNRLYIWIFCLKQNR